ncbi:MAG: hypothetical protein JWO67_818 [Streptosporangiaceae bacterium]|nr:hypothetical protein [Streptosporangiaceae bacterium]
MTDVEQVDLLGRLREEVARCPYHDFLQLAAVSADAETRSVVVRLVNRPEFRLASAGDAIHGGVLAALVDVTGHAAVACATGRVSPTVDLRIDFLAMARGETLTATGRLLKAGRSIARADVEVRDTAGVLVVVGRGTFSTR